MKTIGYLILAVACLVICPKSYSEELKIIDTPGSYIIVNDNVNKQPASKATDAGKSKNTVFKQKSPLNESDYRSSFEILKELVDEQDKLIDGKAEISQIEALREYSFGLHENIVMCYAPKNINTSSPAAIKARKRDCEEYRNKGDVPYIQIILHTAETNYKKGDLKRARELLLNLIAEFSENALCKEFVDNAQSDLDCMDRGNSKDSCVN